MSSATIDQLFLVQHWIEAAQKVARELPPEFKLPLVTAGLDIVHNLVEQQVHVVDTKLAFDRKLEGA